MTEQVPAYQVVSTEDSQVYEPPKGWVRHKKINVRYADGTLTYVEVPLEPDWPQQAQALIEDHYAQHQAVMDTQGPMIQPPPRQRAARPLGQ